MNHAYVLLAVVHAKSAEEQVVKYFTTYVLTTVVSSQYSSSTVGLYTLQTMPPTGTAVAMLIP